MNIPQYASCLLVDPDHKRGLLIIKNRPDWQAGSVNIIGGHIEEDEAPVEAAIREVFEEVNIKIEDPRHFAILHTRTPARAVVYFFVAECDIDSYKQMTDECPIIVDLNRLPNNIIPNLNYLIPLALDKDQPISIINEQQV